MLAALRHRSNSFFVQMHKFSLWTQQIHIWTPLHKKNLINLIWNLEIYRQTLQDKYITVKLLGWLTTGWACMESGAQKDAQKGKTHTLTYIHIVTFPSNHSCCMRHSTTTVHKEDPYLQKDKYFKYLKLCTNNTTSHNLCPRLVQLYLAKPL